MRSYAFLIVLLLFGAIRSDSGTLTTVKVPPAEVKRILQARSQNVKAAHDFAASASKSDEATSIQNFAAALQLAESVMQASANVAQLESAVNSKPTVAKKPTVATNPTMWQKEALNNETFQRNFVKSIDATINRKSILGEPVPVNWRILDGQTTDAFTDCVAVGRDHHFFCSGTIIDRRVVLTAGHCANGERAPKPNMILIGSSINEGTAIDVIKIILHPRLNLGQHPFNDLALLVLKDPVPANVTVRPIAEEEQLYHSFQITVVGFGADTRSGAGQAFGLKRSTDVAIVTYDGSQPDGAAPFGCDAGLEFAASSLEIFRPQVPVPTTRTGNRATPTRSDTCNGDSGGPAYVRGNGDNWVLAGTTSRPIANAAEYVSPGERPTTCGDGGIYVRVDRYWPNWIQQAISDEHLTEQ